MVGLAALLLVFSIPVLLFYRRFSPHEWHKPHLAPLAGLAVLICAYWVDCLSNGFINPVYMMGIGGLNTSVGTARGRRAIALAGAQGEQRLPPPISAGLPDGSLPDAGSPIAATLGARFPSRPS